VAIAFDLQHERRDFGADKQINLLAATIEVAENDGRMFIDFEDLDDSLKNASLGSILRAFGISTEDFNRHGLFVGPVVFHVSQLLEHAAPPIFISLLMRFRQR